MNLLPDEALKLTDKQFQAKFKSFGSKIGDSTVKGYKRLISASINIKNSKTVSGKERRDEVVKDSIDLYKKLGQKGTLLNESANRLRFTVNKVKTNNAKFTDIVNNLIEEFHIDREDALKLADKLLKIPDADIEQLILDGLIKEKEIEIIQTWSP